MGACLGHPFNGPLGPNLRLEPELEGWLSCAPTVEDGVVGFLDDVRDSGSGVAREGGLPTGPWAWYDSSGGLTNLPTWGRVWRGLGGAGEVYVRVIFYGTPDFAVPTLTALVEAGHEVVLVVAQPDKPAGRGNQLQSPPTVVKARELGIPVAQPSKIRSGEFPVQVAALNADVAVVLAYGRILTRALLDAPRLGCINVHGSLLPRWRGAGPIQAAVLAGDRRTGVCTQQMVEALDEGPVFLATETEIGERETAGQLHDRLSLLSADVAVRTLAALGAVAPTPQDPSGVTYCGKVEKEDGRIEWEQPADASDRRIRAMTPWPGGFVPWGEGALKLLEATPVDGEGTPGEILSIKPLIVACGRGALRLDRVQAPGRKPVSGAEFANGARLAVGGRL